MTKAQTIDKIMVTELVLFAENNASLSISDIFKPVYMNLARKKLRGVFDESLAPKAYAAGVREAIKAYNKEFGAGSMWLNKVEKEEAALRLYESYKESCEYFLTELREIKRRDKK